jgi:hypothetical protein
VAEKGGEEETWELGDDGEDNSDQCITEFIQWACNPFKDKKNNCASVDSFDKIYCSGCMRSLGCYSLLGECPRHSDGVSPLGSHQSSLALLSTLPSMYLKKVPSTRLAEHPGHPQDSYPGLAGC